MLRNIGIAIIVVIFFALSSISGADSAGQLTATPRIVGGTEAAPGQFPWIGVMVSAGGDLYQDELCGSTLIAKRWVITAAHCVKNESPSGIEIVFGVHNLETDTGERYKIKQILIHPEFNSETLDSDIALLELYKDCSYDPLPIIDEDLPFTDQLATVLGWGDTSNYRPGLSETLQEVSVPIVSNQDCNMAYSRLPWFTDPISDVMMCAGLASGGKDACSGDSGGPLVIERNGTLKLAGIVSWGEGCAEPGIYGVYTRTSKFIDYIRSITGLEPTTGPLAIYLPHITAGADDWRDFIQVDNNTQAPAGFNLLLYSNGEVIFNQDYVLPALGNRTLDLKSVAPAGACGKITYSEPGLHVRYSSENLTGGGVSEYKMPQGLSDEIVFYFSDVLPGVEWKAIALTNMADMPSEVTLSVISQGAVIAQALVTVPSHDKVIGVYSDWFPRIPVEQVTRLTARSNSPGLCGLSVSGNSYVTTMVVMPAASTGQE